ncbi:MAG: hypothetical protein GY703_16935 [Gammaproteobacteria bacterium]|nr:hypothetical protein [Gammaproteobacteria bacterium]
MKSLENLHYSDITAAELKRLTDRGRQERAGALSGFLASLRERIAHLGSLGHHGGLPTT